MNSVIELNLAKNETNDFMIFSDLLIFVLNKLISQLALIRGYQGDSSIYG
jgi:hypothetical protein